MIVRDRILAVLPNYPEGLDDDSLAALLGLPQRQQANARCRELQRDGLLVRRVVDGKIRNFSLPGHHRPTEASPAGAVRVQAAEGRPWYWEGNVQARVVDHLLNNGYEVLSVADTAARQPGKDVVARKEGIPVWMTVK